MNDHLRSGSPIDPLVSLGYRIFKRLAQALCIGLTCGAFGVVRDVDHIPNYLYQMLPKVYGDFAHIPGRFAHRPGFCAIGIFLVGLSAYAIRRLIVIVKESR